MCNRKKIKILLDTARDMVKARAGVESKSEATIRDIRKYVGAAGRASSVSLKNRNFILIPRISHHTLSGTVTSVGQSSPFLFLDAEIDSTPSLHREAVVSQGYQGVSSDHEWTKISAIFDSY